jgi:hypothetical protein
MVWAGSNLGSYAMAEEAMLELGGVPISARRIRRVVNQVGDERVREREAAVKQFQEMDLPKRRPTRNRSVGSWPPAHGKKDFSRPGDWHLSPTARM